VFLTLSGVERPLEIEFIVDTGFAGELALPGRLAVGLDSDPGGYRKRRAANDSTLLCALVIAMVQWDDSWRAVEVLVLEEGEALLGTQLVHDMALHVEMSEGGQVLIEPL
jgi:predicted aspartyl protease